MNKKVKLIMFLALVFLGLRPAIAASNRTQVLKDSIISLNAEIDQLRKLTTQLDKSINCLDSVISTQQAEITKVFGDLQTFKTQNAETATQINQKNTEIQKLKKERDDLSGELIVTATNFLYLPYNENSIYNVAIPTYNLSKGSPLYDEYKIRLTLLNNYGSDTANLKEFLAKYAQSPIKATDLNNIINEFEKLNCVSNYKEYGSDWDELYLGAIIKDIETNLEKADDLSARIDLNKVFKENLNKLQ